LDVDYDYEAIAYTLLYCGVGVRDAEVPIVT